MCHEFEHWKFKCEVRKGKSFGGLLGSLLTRIYSSFFAVSFAGISDGVASAGFAGPAAGVVASMYCTMTEMRRLEGSRGLSGVRNL